MPLSLQTKRSPSAFATHAPSAPKLLKVSAVAKLLGVSDITVRRRVHDGSLAHFQIRGRLYFSEADVRAFMARNHHGSDSDLF